MQTYAVQYVHGQKGQNRSVDILSCVKKKHINWGTNNSITTLQHISVKANCCILKLKEARRLDKEGLTRGRRLLTLTLCIIVAVVSQ